MVVMVIHIVIGKNIHIKNILHVLIHMMIIIHIIHTILMTLI